MKNRSEQLILELGKKIVFGVCTPGEILPKVEDLSEEYNVSRTVIREAYKGLSTLGLVRSNQRSGTVVLPRTEWQWWNLEVMTWLLEDPNNKDFLLHLTEVRMGLEPTAAALAASRATEQDRMNIEEAFQKLEQSIGDEKAWAKADYDFHESILKASHNDLLIGTIRIMRKALTVSREKTLPLTNDNQEFPYDSPTRAAIEKHRMIYEAIMSRDEAMANKKMTELILRVRTILQKIFNNYS
ncbi:FadR family transcriptional regulator [Bacillus sp. ISL-75]|uniref:FadR/GntR family transcriptional regulator n=1 Tax=Bacillus sp. ISL-75 TaxID=2819137 RepID=UPI001BE7A300|nr:FadR/GntR family transcriptional regulator [Bacillus sp. ISL-75]MBT2730932.1 FadR family transcriptional regulator [Bacillus sp. ISL-75]